MLGLWASNSHFGLQPPRLDGSVGRFGPGLGPKRGVQCLTAKPDAKMRTAGCGPAVLILVCRVTVEGFIGFAVWVDRVAEARRGGQGGCARVRRWRAGHERGPGGEHLAFGDGAQVLEQTCPGAEALPGVLPLGFGEFAGGAQGEGGQVEDDGHGGEGVPAVAEVVFEAAAALLGTLKVSFSIFQRARTQSASSATLSRSAWRLATKAPRQVTAPSGRCQGNFGCPVRLRGQPVEWRIRPYGAGLHGSTPPAMGELPVLPCASAVGDASPAEGS